MASFEVDRSSPNILLSKCTRYNNSSQCLHRVICSQFLSKLGFKSSQSNLWHCLFVSIVSVAMSPAPENLEMSVVLVFRSVKISALEVRIWNTAQQCHALAAFSVFSWLHPFCPTKQMPSAKGLKITAPPLQFYSNLQVNSRQIVKTTYFDTILNRWIRS